MRLKLASFSLLIVLLSSASQLQTTDASLDQLIWKRQANPEGEQETPPAVPAPNPNQPAPSDNNNNQPARLYPDLPRQPSNFVPPFNGQPQSGSNYPAHHGPTPFVPFGLQIPPPNRLNADQQPSPFGRVLPMPKQTTPAERLQSKSFADGLGQRLLSMIGIDTSASGKSKNGETEESNSTVAMSPQTGENVAARALQNVTVLQQLNRGVNSVYGSLSKMYNSTVQEQLNLLQQRFNMMKANNSNPWTERMAQQVPQFFKQMATRLTDAQEQLNRVWRDVSNGTLMTMNRNLNVNNNNNGQAESRSWFNGNSGSGVPFVDQLSNDVNGMFQPGGFFNQMGRSMGFGGDQAAVASGPVGQQQPQQPSQARDLGNQMREFWFNHVQPQVGMVRNQLARVWRELTASGAMAPESMVRSRASNNNLGSASSGTSNENLVDNLIKEVEMTSNNEYTLIEPKNDNTVEASTDSQSQQQQQQQNNATSPKLSLQMQNGLINVQRELNQLWLGLTNSIQGALNNAKNAMNQRPRFATIDMMASNQQQTRAQQQPSDPAQNELNGKVNDLSKLQRDADLVYDAIQQQQREQQQRQMFGDKFRNFFNNVDLGGVEQFPNRLGDTFSRFGNVVGDLWHQIPERWENFMQNIRPTPQPEFNSRLISSTTTTTTTTAKPDSVE